jgi:hypothetical protein
MKNQAAETKRLQSIELYKKDKKEYDEANERNKDKPCLMAWTVNDLKAVVKMEKSKEDGAMPSTKRGIINLYAKCMERKGESVVIEAPTGSDAMQETMTTETAENDKMKTAI